MSLNRSGSCNPATAKVGIAFLGLSLVGYLLGPPLYWHLLEAFAAVGRTSFAASCPPCNCNCDSRPDISFPQDCAKFNPEVNEETEKNFAELLSEELKLREIVAIESQQRADMALLEAKKLTSQYQKEADKCNSGMETCEEAREKAEAALVSQKQQTAVWELRARQRGWKEATVGAREQSQGRVEAS
ncbi:hypothetical protein E3N88_27668 [Mikania micrantha]|uniref:DUF1068 domain-containing protein n=1 Tax=Mikania micrantha TaxID=192012 RepID=A0A5N6MYF8_9ASTR|nr:hypothetical protein E3N88_27668 [Mikania micrantha]